MTLKIGLQVDNLLLSPCIYGKFSVSCCNKFPKIILSAKTKLRELIILLQLRGASYGQT